MVKLNFLPHRVSEEKKRQQQFFRMLGGAMAAGAISVSLADVLLERQIAQQTALVRLLQDEHGKLDAQLRKENELQTHIAELTQRQQRIAALRRQQNETTQLLQTLANQTPSNVHLRTLKQQAAHITLTGSAATPADILQLLANLHGSEGLLSHARLQETHAAQPPSGSDGRDGAGHDFVIVTDITPAARTSPALNSKAMQ